MLGLLWVSQFLLNQWNLPRCPLDPPFSNRLLCLSSSTITSFSVCIKSLQLTDSPPPVQCVFICGLSTIPINHRSFGTKYHVYREYERTKFILSVMHVEKCIVHPDWLSPPKNRLGSLKSQETKNYFQRMRKHMPGSISRSTMKYFTSSILCDPSPTSLFSVTIIASTCVLHGIPCVGQWIYQLCKSEKKKSYSMFVSIRTGMYAVERDGSGRHIPCLAGWAKLSL